MARVIICVIAQLLPLKSSFSASPPPLPVLRAAYTESVTSVRSVKYDMEVRLDERSVRISVPIEAITTFTTVHAVQQGAKLSRLAEDHRKSDDYVFRRWAGYDGVTYARWQGHVKAPPGEGQLPSGSFEVSAPSDLFELSLGTFLGTQLGKNGESLEQFFRRDGVSVIGFEPINGHPCVRVDFPPYAPSPTHPAIRMRLIAWFDLAAGTLPRRIEILPSSQSDAPPDAVYEVSEFQKHDGAGAGLLWMPVQGKVTYTLAQYEVRFPSIAVNPQLVDADFRPSFPLGTLIVDNRPNAPRKRYYAGDTNRELLGMKHYTRLAAAQRAARNIEQRPRRSENTTHNETARPANTSVAIVWLRWFGILAALGAFGFLIKQRISS